MEDYEVCVRHHTGRCDGILYWGADPYDSEINGDETPMWLCEYHIGESSDEI